jgi:hypothetical protein
MHALIEYCRVATLESLRYLADECVLSGDDDLLKVITTEIIKRESADKQITKGYCQQYGITNEGNGTEKAIEADQRQTAPRRPR